MSPDLQDPSQHGSSSPRGHEDPPQAVSGGTGPRTPGAPPQSRSWPRPLKFAVTLPLLVGLVYYYLLAGPPRDRDPQRIASSNMNGLYEIANPLPGHHRFNTDCASKGAEYFDIYSPEIASKYGEVFWRSFPELPLPERIVRRFASSAIAIVGYEHDQVFVRGGLTPGVSPELDVSVPFGWAYNHHYELWVTGSDARMTEFVVAKEDLLGNNLPPGLQKALRAHGMTIGGSMTDGHHHAKPLNVTHIKIRIPVEREITSTKNGEEKELKDVPASQFFPEAPGGESRMSFHGFPQGTAQVIFEKDDSLAIPSNIIGRNRGGVVFFLKVIFLS